MKPIRSILLALALAAAGVAYATLPSTSSRTDLTADGGTDYDFTFKTYATTDVEVFLGGVRQSSGYTVSLNANQTSSPGGTVTFSPAPAAGTAVRIQRTVPLTQLMDLNASSYPAETIERQHDRHVQAAQQIQRNLEDAELGDWTPSAGACAANQWVTAVNTLSAPTCVQPAFSNVSGTVALAQVPRMDPDHLPTSGVDAGVITSGILDAAVGGLGTAQPTCSAGQVVTCDGTTCSCVADSGASTDPVTVTTGAGWTLNASESAVRKGAGVVVFQLSLQATAGVLASPVVTFPAGSRPLVSQVFTGHVTDTSAGKVYLARFDLTAATGVLGMLAYDDGTSLVDPVAVPSTTDLVYVGGAFAY